MSTGTPGRARADRWRTAAELLDAVRRAPGTTRVALARDLGLSSASATEVTARLRGLCWLEEERAPAAGRGRPTSVLRPHTDGPLVVALDLRYEDWTCAVAGLDGVPVTVSSARHDGDPHAVRDALGAAVAAAREEHPGRVLAVGVAVSAPTVDGRAVAASGQGWDAVDLAALTPDGLPVLVGNDATLAGLAEARTGAAAGAPTALYLTVEVGVGGALVLDGRPQTGRNGAAGEFGHLPFGDPAVACACGAHGCWGTQVDGHALARLLAEPRPPDPRSYAAAVVTRARGGDDAARTAVATASAALGRGTAGLVNAHDPDVVVLGGLGPPLRTAAPSDFDAAFAAELMAFRRPSPPPVIDAAHGDAAALHGAAALALDHVTTPTALADRAEERGAVAEPT